MITNGEQNSIGAAIHKEVFCLHYPHYIESD